VNKLIENAIDWSKIGNYGRAACHFDIKKASIKKTSKELCVELSLNFIIPYENLAILRQQLLKELPHLKKVSFVFSYQDLILTNTEIFNLYIDHMIHAVDDTSAHLTKTILSKDFIYDPEENTLVIKAIGDLAISKLNKEVSRSFTTLLQENFGLNISIIFENHEELYQGKAAESAKRAIHEARTAESGSSGKISRSTIPQQSNGKLQPPRDGRQTSGRLFGRPISESSIKIRELTNTIGTAVVSGKIFGKTDRAIRNGKKLVSLLISDGTGSICAKSFMSEEKLVELDKYISIGDSIKIKGIVDYDKYENSLVISVKDIEKVTMPKRQDLSLVKRVELHAHTKMSAMDGLNDTKELIKTAFDWGHKAIAITDHGVAQAFPDAMDMAKKLKGGIKVIYGLEGYIFDDEITATTYPEDLTTESAYIVFDLETTGLSALKNEIIEIGAVHVKNKEIINTFQSFVHPTAGSIPAVITELTGISYDMVRNAPPLATVYQDFMAFVSNLPLVAHNADFDVSFLKEAAKKFDDEINQPIVDTLFLSRLLLKDLKKHKLNLVAQELNVPLDNHHRAVDDATATAMILIKLFQRLESDNIYKLNDTGKLASNVVDFKNKETYHIIILVQNHIGLKNLYKLISLSHMNFFYKKPRIPKSILAAHREGLILGSACQAGELYQYLLNKRSEKDIDKIVNFYDYLEIQPLINNEFLIHNEKVEDLDALIAINKEIIRCGENAEKLVVATCDAHYVEPEEALYRKILMAGQGYKDIEGDKGLFFRTTEEMFDEFSYLDEDTIQKVVIDNPNIIAERIEFLNPIPDGKFPPKIEGSDDSLRTICWKTARKIYGETLPEIVQKRLDRELKSIINHGYAVMYVAAQMLVEKSMQSGYLVGSRGSVGSSFAATMSGITEVNPLPPHYICPNCRHSDFSVDENYDCGVDLPDKTCPHCGTLYNKDGFSIPFEVFLGFEGDKEPDIDLNFAGEYQSIAHKYTETIFGPDNVFRAGTIGTIASKTAYGFVMKYFEEREEIPSKWEAERLTQCCTGVKRTTGQHPGGVMIVPQDKEIYDFCPIQFPANDAQSGIVTTHFDYHSISSNLLKLDILGHDVPTMIKMLQDMTGLDPIGVPLKDKRVDSIFTGVEGIDIKMKNYRYNHGSFGVPEFGTRFVRQMLDATKPASFSDLIRISGLSHGTNVWINNAQELILSGTAQLKDVISTRDDIMNFLINKGVSNKIAFKIMENVRKGKGVDDDEASVMLAHGVPAWYVESCRKIEYMFPKAHAVAYVMMSYRIAYYKVYYPAAFYAVAFSMRVSEFDAETILQGIQAIDRRIRSVEDQGKEVSKKEEGEVIVLELAYEMYARGYEFLPARIGFSDALKFKIVEGKVLLPLNALPGVGENAALAIVEEFASAPFMSVDDLKNRTRINKTAIAALEKHGALHGMPESDQMTLF
jgi:DNA polymerase-3 subunit alpha (Gram-positive type)